MPTPEQYDAIIIGSGEAGKFMAWHLGSHGSRVIAIEKDAIGGACPNVACLPSKNVVHSAKVASYFQRGAEFGMVHDEWHVDMATVRAHKRKMVEGLAEVHLNNFKKSGAEFAMGFGKFIGPKTVQVDLNAGGTRTLTADKIFIDTGSRATIDPIPGLAEGQTIRVSAKVRHRHTPAMATLNRVDENTVHALFDEPQRAITPGQSAVFYQEDEVVGGGWII